MKKMVTVVMMLAGSVAVVAAVLQRMEKYTKIWVGAAGAAGTVEKQRGPTVVFSLKRVSAATVLGLVRKIGTAISSLSAAYLCNYGKK